MSAREHRGGVAAKPMPERFWLKVAKRGPDECWLWQAATDKDGYGHIRGSDGRRQQAHRASWEIANSKPVPIGMVIMHGCDTPSCVNPRHLSAGTPKANTADMIAKGRSFWAQQTHCVRGHEFNATNTFIRNGRHRRCRVCRRVGGEK